MYSKLLNILFYFWSTVFCFYSLFLEQSAVFCSILVFSCILSCLVLFYSVYSIPFLIYSTLFYSVLLYVWYTVSCFICLSLSVLFYTILSAALCLFDSVLFYSILFLIFLSHSIILFLFFVRFYIIPFCLFGGLFSRSVYRIGVPLVIYSWLFIQIDIPLWAVWG